MKKWNYKSINGKATMSSYVKNSLLQDQKENENAIYQIKRLSAESKKQRGFFEGAVLPLYVYLDGHDHRNSEIIKFYREQLKKQFNGSMITRSGKKEIIGGSTKGILTEFTEKVIIFLEEQYAINRNELLDTRHYKKWIDEIYSVGMCETYIEYLEEIGRLPIKM